MINSLTSLLCCSPAAEVESVGFSWRGCGAVAAHSCSAPVGQAVPGVLWGWCGIIGKAALGSSRTSLCPTAPVWGLSSAPAPRWALRILCAAPAEPHPDLLGLMAPTFISPFHENVETSVSCPLATSPVGQQRSSHFSCSLFHPGWESSVLLLPLPCKQKIILKTFLKKVF